MSYLIGVDIGTSGTKTVLFDVSGNTIASSTKEYPMYQPENGWAEQDPLDWWVATYESINEVLLKSGVKKEDIKGIGLSGQMHGLVMLDKNGNVLRRSIIWCDQRTSAECKQITDIIGSERLIEITANPALTGFTASKIMWIKNNEPHIYEKCFKILLPKDYIRYMLTGEFATEVSDASGMQLMDIHNRCWSDEIITKLGLNKDMLPRMYESYEVSGKVNEAASEKTGLSVGTPVVGGAGDQAAGAVGNGIVKEGIVSSTIGTSGVVFAFTNRPVIDKLGRIHTFCHAIPNAWHVMGVTQAAGLSLKWFKDDFCEYEKDLSEASGVNVYEILNNEASKSEPGAKGLIYLPYLMGERTPHLDPKARGVFFGISAIHTKNDFIRAIMEGVAYSLKDCLALIEENNIKVEEVRASGGGARSELWRQMQSDIFEKRIVTVNSTEGPALGVAILAGVGTGIYNSIEEACNSILKRCTTREPNTNVSEVYKNEYEKYKQIYLRLKNIF